MTNIIIPRGHIWLKDLSADFTEIYIDIIRHLGIFDVKKKDWQYAYSQEAFSRLQQAFVNGDLTGLVFGEDEIVNISKGYWARGDREHIIETGLIQYKSDHIMPIFVDRNDYTKYTEWNNTFIKSPEASAAEFQDANTSFYVTPFVELLIKAIREHNISENYAPPVKELERWFLAAKLSDQTPISPNQAKMLATFSRPPRLMRGGHYKQQKPND